MAGQRSKDKKKHEPQFVRVESVVPTVDTVNCGIRMEREEG